MQKAKKQSAKMTQSKAKPKIGDKRPRSVAVPVAHPVRDSKAKVTVMSRGKDSTIMTIIQPLSDVQNAMGATGGNVLVNATLATLLTNMLILCPSQLNGSIQAEGQIWTNWRFLSMKFHYIPTCPTTTSGALVFGFSDAPATIAGTDISSFSIGRAVRNAVTTSVYQPVSFSANLNSDDKVLRINDAGTLTGTITDKLAYNKVFFARTDIAAPAATTINYGYLNIEVTVEFTQLMTSQGFTLHASSMEEKLILASIRDTLFPKRAIESPPVEPVDGIGFLLSRLGLPQKRVDDDVSSTKGSVKSWVMGSR